MCVCNTDSYITKRRWRVAEVTHGTLVVVQRPKWGGPGQATERDRAQGVPGAGTVGQAQREAAQGIAK